MGSGEKGSLKSFGEFSLEGYTYEVLFDPQSGTWFVRRLDEERLRPVYRGDLEVVWVRDVALGEDFYLVKSDNETIYGYDLDAVIKLFTKTFSYKVNRYFVGPLLRLLIMQRGKRDGHFFGGFYAEGFVEGYIPYPAKSWDCDPRSLEAMAKYITEAFPPFNRANALANVALAIAKVFSPGVRLAVRHAFEDHIVINTPDIYPNLRRLFGDIIKLLGLDSWSVYFDAETPVYRSAEVLRDVLMHSNAPLLLDEVDERGLDVVLSVAVGNNHVLRSIMVNTMLDHHEVDRLLAKHYKSKDMLDWALRKMIIIKWSPMRRRRDVEPFSGKPILGCLRELWQDQGFRQRALNEALGVVDLARMVMEALHTRYGVDTTPYTQALRLLAVAEAEGQAEGAGAAGRQRPEDLVVSRMYEIARQVLGAENVSTYRVLRALVEDPGRFDVRVTGSRWKYMVEKDLREWEALARSLGYAPEKLAVSPSDPGFEGLSDTEKALAYVWWLISSGKNRLIIYAGSTNGVYPGWARRLFGSGLGRYGGRKGYSVSWVMLLRHMLSAGSVSTGKAGTEGSTGSAGGTGSP